MVLTILIFYQLGIRVSQRYLGISSGSIRVSERHLGVNCSPVSRQKSG